MPLVGRVCVLVSLASFAACSQQPGASAVDDAAVEAADFRSLYSAIAAEPELAAHMEQTLKLPPHAYFTYLYAQAGKTLPASETLATLATSYPTMGDLVGKAGGRSTMLTEGEYRQARRMIAAVTSSSGAALTDLGISDREKANALVAKMSLFVVHQGSSQALALAGFHSSTTVRTYDPSEPAAADPVDTSTGKTATSDGHTNSTGNRGGLPLPGESCVDKLKKKYNIWRDKKAAVDRAKGVASDVQADSMLFFSVNKNSCSADKS